MPNLMAPQLQQASESEVTPSATSSAAPVLDRDGLTQRIEQLGEWFHNLDLHGVQDGTEPLSGRLSQHQVEVYLSGDPCGSNGGDCP